MSLKDKVDAFVESYRDMIADGSLAEMHKANPIPGIPFIDPIFGVCLSAYMEQGVDPARLGAMVALMATQIEEIKKGRPS